MRKITTKILNWLKNQKHQKYTIWTLLSIFFITISINSWIIYSSHNFIHKNEDKIPACYTGIILGAFINQQGIPSYALKDRLDKSIELYRTKKIKRILVSGDHGQKEYDEVNHMRNYLLKKGIPSEDIFLDHAGFDTYNSMVRAKKVFLVKNAIVITQAFHLPRAIYIARNQELNAYGIEADKRVYHHATWYQMREFLARIKAFLEVNTHKNPVFLGETISIYSNSDKTHD